MGDAAAAAILDALIIIGKCAAAILSQGIKRTITEKAIEILSFHALMTGEIFAFGILEKGIMPFFFAHANTILFCQMHSLCYSLFFGEILPGRRERSGRKIDYAGNNP